MNVKDGDFKALMEKYKTICVYGLSNDPAKPSHYVPVYMREQGWDVVGIYPFPHDVGGFKIYTSLRDVPAEQRKFVDVFRASAKLDHVVDDVIDVGGVEVLWFQLGIFNPTAEARAENSGLRVVSNRCLIVEHRNYFG